MWSIWKERNSKIFRNTSCSHNQVQDLILTRLSWWIKGWGSSFPYSCNEIIRNPRSLSWCEARPFAVMLQPNPDAHWSPPPLDFIKWNVDASMNPTFPMSAIGGVLRNDRGQLMCVFSSPIPLIEINSAEIMAIYRAVQITMAYENLKNVKIMIESDSANAVRWCNEDLGDHGISISSWISFGTLEKIGGRWKSFTKEGAPTWWQIYWQSKACAEMQNFWPGYDIASSNESP